MGPDGRHVVLVLNEPSEDHLHRFRWIMCVAWKSHLPSLGGSCDTRRTRSVSGSPDTHGIGCGGGSRESRRTGSGGGSRDSAKPGVSPQAVCCCLPGAVLAPWLMSLVGTPCVGLGVSRVWPPAEPEVGVDHVTTAEPEVRADDVTPAEPEVARPAPFWIPAGDILPRG